MVAIKEQGLKSTGVPVADRAAVLLPLPLAGAYDYRVSGQRGLIVRAPLGRREVLGAVWGPGEAELAEAKLKDAAPVFPPARLKAPLCDFIDWVARYTLTPLGQVLALALRPISSFDREVPRRALVLGTHLSVKPTPARQRVLAIMQDGLTRLASDIAEQAGVTVSVVRALEKAGALKSVSLPEFDPFPVPHSAAGAPVLNPDQMRAGAHFRERVRAREFSASLLDGVTGSGKTEAYFEAVAEALDTGRQALILMPEIALTVQFLERFAKRFGAAPAEFHSDMTTRQKMRVYRAVMRGEAKVVVGARSSLFLPFDDLGLIIVDEEHEHAYKQEEGVIYHARDMAVVRARLENCPIILSSATPSLESFVNAKSGRYAWEKLKLRYGAAEMPEVKLVDMRESGAGSGQFLSTPLREALARTLDAGEQALLFLNRRGYAPLTLCNQCGHKETCRDCSAWLVEHRYRKRLVCHHCGYHTKMPEVCPQCAAENSFVACGPGVERVWEEFTGLFPNARAAIASSDTLHGPSQTQAAIHAFAEGEIDVLIGTQIVAKGHHFPQLTLAGIVDADLGASAGDPRAAERCFQLLHQVSGRAGRAEKPGLVLIQTRNLQDRVMQALASSSRDDFLNQEAEARQRSLTPPFGRLAALILSGNDAAAVQATGRALAAAAPRAPGVTVWGPAPAFYQMLRGKMRERLLVQAEKTIDMQNYLRAWLSTVKIPSSVRLAVDVDPISFF